MLVVLAASLLLGAQGAPVDLRIVTAKDRPLLVEIHTTVDADAVITTDGAQVSEPYDRVRKLRFIDTLLDDGPARRSRREFLTWNDTRNGRVKDPELNGHAIDYDQRDGAWQLQFANDRYCDQATLDRHLHLVDTIGLPISLPESVSVGDTFAVDLERLLPFVLDSTELPDASAASMTFASLEGNVALLEGDLACTANDIRNGVLSKGSFQGRLALRIDVAEHRLASLAWSGAVELGGGSKSVQIAGSGTFDASVAVSTGQTVAAASKEKPVYRAVFHELPDLGLSFELPSHWFQDTKKGDIRIFRSALYGRNTARVLEVRVFPQENAADKIPEMQRSFQDEKKAKLKNVRSNVGAGRSATFEDEGRIVTVDLFPIGEDRVLWLRFHGVPEKHAEFQKDYKHVLDTLEVERVKAR
jgi:hypothetical protein